MQGDMEITPSLSDYQSPEGGEQMVEYAEFSPRFQAFRLFRTCLALQASQNYSRARRTFYDSLSWFEIAFDPVFVRRCQHIIDKYASEDYVKKYTYEQIEQLKFMRIVWEFSVMLLDSSTHNQIELNTNPSVQTELVPIGYAQIFNYEHMAMELFLILTQIQRQQTQKDAIKFFNHSIAWFGGIFDAKFTIQGYIIDQTETNVEQRYRKLVAAFAKLLTRKSVMTTPFATLVYKPPAHYDTPHSVEDIVKQATSTPHEITPSVVHSLLNSGEQKILSPSENEAVIAATLGSILTGEPQVPEGDTNTFVANLKANLGDDTVIDGIMTEDDEIKEARLKNMEDRINEMIVSGEDEDNINALSEKMERVRKTPAQHPTKATPKKKTKSKPKKIDTTFTDKKPPSLKVANTEKLNALDKLKLLAERK